MDEPARRSVCLALRHLSLLSLLFTLSCQSAAPTSTTQSSQPLIPVGALMDEYISYEFTIYYLPDGASRPMDELVRLLAEQFPEFERVNLFSEHPAGLELVAQLEGEGPDHPVDPPDAETLQFNARGISETEALALQQAEWAVSLRFKYPRKLVWSGLKSATQLANELAQRTGGFLLDVETGLWFSPEAWIYYRLDGWDETIPELSRHFTIHFYQKGELNRAISLGLAKFGLPDLVVERVSRSNARNVGHIINLLAQILAEGATITKSGEFDLDIRKIQLADVREPQIQALKQNATGVALLTLHDGVWEEGDPRNRLVEITFERGTGPDFSAQQESILSQAFGFEDSVVTFEHDESVKAASQRAREKLPQLRDAIKNGLAPGELVLVKAPFDAQDGVKEWMWVEVVSWDGNKIVGLLQNDPFDIPNLKAGQSVEVSEATVFDYIHAYADGTIEGNETEVMIRKQSQ